MNKLREAAQLAIESLRHAPYINCENAINAVIQSLEAALAQPAEPAVELEALRADKAMVPLTVDELWHNDALMSLNAEANLTMDQLVSITRAIETAIHTPTRRKTMTEKEMREALTLFVKAAYPVAQEINPRGHNWSEAYLDAALGIARAAIAHAKQKGSHD